MTYSDAITFIDTIFKPAIYKMLEATFEDAFLHVNTRELEVHKNTSPNISKFNLAIIRSLSAENEHPKYRRNYDIDPNDWVHVKRMYDDFMKSEKPVEFLIEYVGVEQF